MHVEGKSLKHLPKLGAKVIALYEHHVGRRAKALVAGEYDSIFSAGGVEEFRATERALVENVGAEQPQPPCKPREHPIRRKFGSLVHPPEMYYSRARPPLYEK